MSSQNLEKSMLYETLLEVTRSDYKKSFELYKVISSTEDINLSLPLYASKIESVVGLSSEELCDVWRRVRDIYSSKRLSYEIIDMTSPLFPQGLLDSEFPLPMFYAIGNITLLEKPRVTVLGSFAPSLKAKEIVSDFISHIDSKSVLVVPLDIGIPSLAAAELLKTSGNVIAVSSQFLSVAPVEVLKLQMMDILRRGGLITTPFGPATRSEKWHNVIRNRAISAFSRSAFLVEEKDGGPSWKIFDLIPGDQRFISSHMLESPAFSFARCRAEDGVPVAYGEKEYKALLKKRIQRRVKTRTIDETPDLFELTN